MWHLAERSAITAVFWFDYVAHFQWLLIEVGNLPQENIFPKEIIFCFNIILILLNYNCIEKMVVEAKPNTFMYI